MGTHAAEGADVERVTVPGTRGYLPKQPPGPSDGSLPVKSQSGHAGKNFVS